ncbi:MAG TPA: hypothetical protein VGN12_00520 [Pirellulales bacterium]|jgi:hypothetical protein
MSEPDVTLTDYAVAIEAVVLLILLRGTQVSTGALGTWLALFFGSICAASLFGGTVHGFLRDERTLAYRILWPATLVAMGVTAFSMYAIGAELTLSPEYIRWMVIAAATQFLIYAAVIVFARQDFWLGIADNLPAILFLLFAIALKWRNGANDDLSLALAGLGLVLVAAALQYLQLGIHPIYLNHNALYHVLQGLALFLFFLGIRSINVNSNEQTMSSRPVPHFIDLRASHIGTSPDSLGLSQ